MSDRIVVMNAGRAEQIARPHEAYERPATPFVASFLGKTTCSGPPCCGKAIHVCRDRRWRWPVLTCSGKSARDGAPEKIGFGDSVACSMGGRIKLRIFQGNHWLYQVETPGGLVTVTRPNAGEAAPEEGATVRVTWRAEDMVVQPEAS